MTCGIYQILNTHTGQCYVGSSIDIENRWNNKKGHINLLNLNRHPNSKLQNAWNKYGPRIWEWNILQECLESNLDELEAFWQARMNSCSNGYDCNFLVLENGKVTRKHSEETKEKIRKSCKGKNFSEEHKKKIGDAHRGKKLSNDHKLSLSYERSKETKKKISEAKKGKRPSNFGKPMSEAQKLKISESRKKLFKIHAPI